jgi:hypothetical protein
MSAIEKGRSRISRCQWIAKTICESMVISVMGLVIIRFIIDPNYFPRRVTVVIDALATALAIVCLITAALLVALFILGFCVVWVVDYFARRQERNRIMRAKRLESRVRVGYRVQSAPPGPGRFRQLLAMGALPPEAEAEVCKLETFAPDDDQSSKNADVNRS